MKVTTYRTARGTYNFKINGRPGIADTLTRAGAHYQGTRWARHLTTWQNAINLGHRVTEW